MSCRSQINETGPQRYDEWESGVSHITEIKDGRFVKHDDYTAIAAENAALKAEVERLTTWVEIDFDSVPLCSISGAECSGRSWVAPCDCLVRVEEFGDFTLSNLMQGEVKHICKEDKHHYLPITLPEEPDA